MKSLLGKILGVAIIGIIAAIIFANQLAKVEPPSKPLRDPVLSIYDHSIAGAGIIEAVNENVSVGVYYPGKIDTVFMQEDETVKAGTPLFKIDNQDILSELMVIKAKIKSQHTVINRLIHLPRQEDILSAKAQLKIEETKAANAQEHLKKIKSLSDQRALSKDQIDKAHYEVETAYAGLHKAKADYKTLLAGAWIYDIQKAKADLEVLQAQENALKIKLEQSVIKAPKSGKILQMNLKRGEYVANNTTVLPSPVIIGDVSKLQVRVDIDEVNAPDVKPHMKATAFIKGDTSKKIDLQFERIEPFIIPKKNLTGENTERIDIRVLQLIYSFTPPKFPVYVGQQVDVFLEK